MTTGLFRTDNKYAGDDDKEWYSTDGSCSVARVKASPPSFLINQDTRVSCTPHKRLFYKAGAPLKDIIEDALKIRELYFPFNTASCVACGILGCIHVWCICGHKRYLCHFEQLQFTLTADERSL